MEITVEVQDVTGKYILRQHIGEGKYDGHEFSLFSAMNGSLIVEIDSKSFAVASSDITKAVVERVKARGGQS